MSDCANRDNVCFFVSLGLRREAWTGVLSALTLRWGLFCLEWLLLQVEGEAGRVAAVFRSHTV